MPDFHIVSRRGGAPQYWAYNTNDGSAGPNAGSDHPVSDNIPPTAFFAAVAADHQTVTSDHVHIATLNWANMKFFIWADATYGPYIFPADVPLLLTPTDDPNHTFVNLDNTLGRIDATLQNDPNTQTGPKVIGPPGAAVVVTQVMTALLNGLATGLAAAGPEFAPVAGPVSALAGLLAMSWTQPSPPPAPPSLADIKTALGDVTQLADAQKAGEFFTSSYLWFLREATSIDFYGKSGNGVPPTLQQEYESAVTDALGPDSGSLYSTLFYVSAHPEIGKYILPEFLTGIGLYIHLKRIHLGEIFLQAAQAAKSHVGVADPDQIQDLITDATNLQGGFMNAQDAFVSMRNQIVGNYGLSNIPEAMLAMKKVSQAYTGDPYAVVDATYATTFPSGCLVTDDADGQTSWLYDEEGYPVGYQDPILNGYNQLTSVINLIREDLNTVETNGGWPQNMFNVNWGTPVVSSGSFSTLGFNSMTLHGQVTAKGSPTSYHFEYGTTTGYGSAAPAPDASAGSGMTPVPVSQPISGLTPGTTYHFRLVATNENGTIASPDATFICTGETPGGPRLGVPHLAPGH